MRIIAFSDSHGNTGVVKKLISSTRSTTDLYIFLGGGSRDIDRAGEELEGVRLLKVRGNCDFSSSSPDTAVTEVLGYKIIYTHGHTHGIKYDTAGLERLAFQNGAAAVLFGHTHVRECLYRNGVYYINPGSIALPRDGMPPSYAAIDIIPAGIMVTHAEL